MELLIVQEGEQAKPTSMNKIDIHYECILKVFKVLGIIEHKLK